MESSKFFATAIAVLGVREILSPAVRTLFGRGFGLNRLPAPRAELGCRRKVLVAF
jgi:hypothetical protein